VIMSIAWMMKQRIISSTYPLTYRSTKCGRFKLQLIYDGVITIGREVILKRYGDNSSYPILRVFDDGTAEFYKENLYMIRYRTTRTEIRTQIFHFFTTIRTVLDEEGRPIEKLRRKPVVKTKDACQSFMDFVSARHGGVE